MVALDTMAAQIDTKVAQAGWRKPRIVYNKRILDFFPCPDPRQLRLTQLRLTTAHFGVHF